MKPQEYITTKRRHALRDAIGRLIAEQQRSIKYLLRGDYALSKKAQVRFYLATDRLIDLHRQIPDE